VAQRRRLGGRTGSAATLGAILLSLNDTAKRVGALRLRAASAAAAGAGDGGGGAQPAAGHGAAGASAGLPGHAGLALRGVETALGATLVRLSAMRQKAAGGGSAAGAASGATAAVSAHGRDAAAPGGNASQVLRGVETSLGATLGRLSALRQKAAGGGSAPGAAPGATAALGAQGRDATAPVDASQALRGVETSLGATLGRLSALRQKASGGGGAAGAASGASAAVSAHGRDTAAPGGNASQVLRGVETSLGATLGQLSALRQKAAGRGSAPGAAPGATAALGAQGRDATAPVDASQVLRGVETSLGATLGRLSALRQKAAGGGGATGAATGAKATAGAPGRDAAAPGDAGQMLRGVETALGVALGRLSALRQKATGGGGAAGAATAATAPLGTHGRDAAAPGDASQVLRGVQTSLGATLGRLSALRQKASGEGGAARAASAATAAVSASSNDGAAPGDVSQKLRDVETSLGATLGRLSALRQKSAGGGAAASRRTAEASPAGTSGAPGNAGQVLRGVEAAVGATLGRLTALRQKAVGSATTSGT
jgi:hypothetical protein